MARKSTARDIVEIISWMPWWAGVLAAAISYLLFSALASQPLTSAAGAAVGINLLAVFSTALRWVVPLLCLAGAVASFVGRSERRNLLAQAQGAPGTAVASMDWREFEMLVGEAFRAQGYSVIELGGAGPDGGVDLVLRRGEEKMLVQCKHWKTYRVGVAVVREMLGSMTARQVRQGWIITSGRYTAEARRFAGAHGIRLVDGESLPALLGAGKAAAPTSGTAASAHVTARPVEPGRTPPARAAAPPAGEGWDRVPAAPNCPACGQPMVERIARKGARAGEAFWGCQAYPTCRGTRPK